MKNFTQLEIVPTGKEPLPNWYWLTTPDEFDETIEELKTFPPDPDFGELILAFDIETTGLNPFEDKILAFAFCDGKRSFFVEWDKFAASEHADWIFSDEVRLVMHNAKFDLKFLKEKGEDIPNKFHDTMLLTYVLDSSQKNYSLDALCKVVLNEPNEWKSEVSFKKMTPPMIKLYPYTCADVHYTYKMFKVLYKALNNADNKLEFIYRLELALSKVLIDMELEGCKLDLEGLHRLSSELFDKEIRLEEKIHNGRPFNINSLKQLKQRLVEAGDPVTKTLRQVDLEGMKSDFAQDVLQYRKVHKMRATYVEPLANKLDDRGHIHCDYKQHGTATGRISCQNPNLQNVPRGDTTAGVGSVSIRSLFINPYPPETELLIIDYKQIEMRFFAHYAQDERVIKAITSGEDLHKDTAATIFDAAYEEVSKEQRTFAKTINFGIIYGMREGKLADTLGIGVDEATDMLHRYYMKYPAVKRLQESCTDYVRKKKFIKNYYGRRRLMPQQKYHAALNTLIQSTAADFFKIKMIKLWKFLLDYKSHIVLNVHDEIVIVHYKEEDLQKQIMDVLEERDEFRVPILCDAIVSQKSWAAK
jgi:DNA polymerase-1